MADHPKPLEGEILAERDLLLLADPEQLELIRDQVPGRDAGLAVRVAEQRGRGRPPGSRNKRNAKFRDQILAMGPHPGLNLMRAYSTPIDVLAEQLQCSRLEAAHFSQRASIEMLPYLEGKQPISVDVVNKHDVVLVFAGNGAVDGGQLEAIADQVNAHGVDAIDWGEAVIGSVLEDGEDPGAG